MPLDGKVLGMSVTAAGVKPKAAKPSAVFVQPTPVPVRHVAANPSILVAPMGKHMIAMPDKVVWPTHIRASSLYKWCPRAEAIESVYGKPERAKGISMGYSEDGERIPLHLQHVFEMGTGIHAQYQDHVLGPAGLLWGQWYCEDCGAKWGKSGAWVKHPDANMATTGSQATPYMTGNLSCIVSPPRRCLSIRFIEDYGEHSLLQISGHPDGVVTRPGKSTGSYELGLLEMKTIGKASFDRLTKPTADHIIQNQAYMEIFDLPFVIFLYMSRGWHDKDLVLSTTKHGHHWGPFKEFIVERDDTVVRHVASARENIESAIALKKPFAIDRLRACASPMSARCRECAIADTCWNTT